MSSRHRDRHRERRSRSRSPYENHRRPKEDLSRSKSDRESESYPERYKERRKDRERSRDDRVSLERRRERKDKSHSHGHFERSKKQDDRSKEENEDYKNNERTRKIREAFFDKTDEISSQPKDEPNFELSGKLTEYTNTYKGVVIKYNEPPEALKPKTRWRLYPFKGDQAMSVLYIHRQSAYLIGRQRHIVDLAVDHPSCSKQHAVLQYRLVSYERNDGTPGRKCKPYIIDLESANGTFLNNQKIEARRYYELKEKDVLKFGFSSREYVLLHEKMKESEEDDDDDVTEETSQQD